MTTAQYYQVRLEDAISLYREGNLTACGLLKLYIKIKFAPGWQIGLIPEQVCKVLGIAKATFYKALTKVKEQDNLKQIKIINKIMLGDELNSTNEPKNLQSPTVESDSPIVESQSPTRESQSTIVENESPTVESESPTVENESPKEPDSKQQSDSPDLSSDSYSKFISSLSSSERENFLDFCKRRTDSFDIPLKCSLRTFLAARNKETNISYFAEFWDLYQKEGDVVLNPTEKSNTTGMKPNLEKWYYWMNQTGRMVRKYEKNGVVFIFDNCGQRRTFEQWLTNWSMEAAKKQFDASSRWGR